jgi:hypothetical protein
LEEKPDENVDIAEKHLLDATVSLDKKASIQSALIEYYRKNNKDDEMLAVIEYLDPLLRGAGRLVQSASNFDKLTGNGWVKAMNKYLTERGVELPKEVKKNLSEAFQKAAKIGDEKQRAQELHKVAEELVSHVPLKLGSWLDAYRYTNMLSNPQAHERNVVGNLINQLVTRPLALASQGEIKGATKYLQKSLGAVFSGKAFVDAYRNFKGGDFGKLAETMDDPNISIFDMIKREAGPQNKAGRMAWKTVTAIPRFLGAQDAFFGSMIEAGETARLIQKGELPEVAAKQANDLANKLLYRNKLGIEKSDKSLDILTRGLDSLGNFIEKGRKSELIGTPIKWVIPFLKTPVNIAKLGIQSSPLAFFTKGMNRNSISKSMFQKDFADLTPEQQTTVKAELTNRRGLASVGTMVTVLGAVSALKGMTTWNAPKDEEAKKLFYKSGRRPYSFMVNGKWYPLAYLGPFMFAFGIPAAARDAFADNPEAVSDDTMDKVLKVATSIPKMILSQTPVSGLSTVLDALQGRIDKKGQSALGFGTTQFIPASGLVRWINKIVDPTYRKAVTAGETIKAGIPFLSKDIEARIDPEGEESKRDWTDIYMPYAIGKTDKEWEEMFQFKQEELRGKEELKSLEKQTEKEIRLEEIKANVAKRKGNQ